MRVKFIHLLLGAMSASGCGDDSSSSGEDRLEGFRYKVALVRAADETDWVEVKGIQEWWFFSAGVFRQISADYVEPQFYGDNQACNGSGSGAWAVVEPGEGEQARENLSTVSLAYDGMRDVRGLCRMTDRSLLVTLQPSGAVDVIDGKRAVRLSRIEKIQ